MKTILILDDEPTVRTAMKRVLTRAGYKILEAANGAVGIRLLDSEELLPDLIITDLLMPDKEGLETIHVVRKRWPSIPIIAISGGGEHTAGFDFLDVARKLGAALCLPKPIDSDRLLESIAQLLPE